MNRRPCHVPLALTAIAVALATGCSGEPPAETTPGATAAAATPATDAPAAAAPPARPGPPNGPAATRPARTPPEDETVARFAGLTAPKPATWKWLPPESQMRAANYVVPGPSGTDQAHLVVFHGIGGGVQMNVDRWKGMFRTADQRPVEASMTKLDVGGLPVTIVEIRGEYKRMGAVSYTPDQLFLMAIVETPEGDLQIRLVGETATVDAAREDFMTLIKGLRRE